MRKGMKIMETKLAHGLKRPNNWRDILRYLISTYYFGLTTLFALIKSKLNSI
jgi:hypothetical protein